MLTPAIPLPFLDTIDSLSADSGLLGIDGDSISPPRDGRALIYDDAQMIHFSAAQRGLDIKTKRYFRFDFLFSL